MTTMAFLIDNRKCIGCHACTVACKSEHEVPLGVDRTWVKYVEKGAFPHNRRLFTVMRCNHCDHAPCVNICPVTSLYRRADGVVDFHSDRCIGCKACMQACPYDALHIHPDDHTAAKCNFCTHRLEVGLEPSCVVVCPEQAIVCGDLDNPTSALSQLVERFPVQVRKPEKGTQPKLFYIEGDAAALVPERAPASSRTMWSSATEDPDPGRVAEAVPTQTVTPEVTWPVTDAKHARRAYDVPPRKPAWGWPVVAYTWTKSVACGAVLAACGADLLRGEFALNKIAALLSLIALVFLAATTALLVADLKQPKRFLYVLLRPQWNSWLVRGAYFLTAFGIVTTAWAAAAWTGHPSWSRALMWPAALLAVPTAAYTAFLFAQSKGRDFWQNPLLAAHFLVHALLAAAGLWIVAGSALDPQAIEAARRVAAIVIGLSLVSLLGEILTTHPTNDARKALRMILGRPYGEWFWGGAIFAGHLLPLGIVLWVPDAVLLAPLLMLAGLAVLEYVWVIAPQKIPLS